jgi:subtilisin family serine protease
MPTGGIEERRFVTIAHHLAAGVALIATSTALSQLAPTTDSTQWVPGELIVGFHDDVSLIGIDGILPYVGDLLDVREIPHAPHPKGQSRGVHPLAMVRVLSIDPGADVVAIAADLEASGLVRYAHPNWTIELCDVPNDPHWGSQYGPAIMDAPLAWDLTQGDASIIVCVADTGTNFGHEDFQGDAIWVNEDEVAGNGVDDDGNGYIDDIVGWDGYYGDNDPTDGAGHGSHVAGTIAARLNNGVGMAGMANVRIMTFKVFSDGGGGTWEALTAAVYYAVDNGALTFNISGGGGGGLGALAEACTYAWDNGMTVVAAAGNYDSNAEFYPAWYPEVLSIAATDSSDNRAGFSNWGPEIDVAAPGVDVFSAWWDSSGAYTTISGTSMASPHACGVTALMYSINPDLTPQEVRDTLRATAVDLGDAGFDEYFGYGRVDAYAAVLAVAPSDLTMTVEGLVGRVDPDSDTVLSVMIEEVAGSLDPGTPTLHVRLQGTGTFTEIPLTAIAEGQFEGVLEAGDCDDHLEVFLSAASTGGEVVMYPEEGDTSPHLAKVAWLLPLSVTDGETDGDWSSAGGDASAGHWERGTPVDDPSWPFDPTGDGDGSGQCWLTENTNGNSDVDGGSTHLESAVFDGSDGELQISYMYLLLLAGNTEDDSLTLSIESDGSGKWIEVARHDENGDVAWFDHTISHDDLEAAGVTMSPEMRLRFTATDGGSGSTVEAGLDAIAISKVSCELPVYGGCCVGITCFETTEGDCTGTWYGAGTDCTSTNCGGIAHAIVGHDLLSIDQPNWTVDIYIQMPNGMRLDAVAGTGEQTKMVSTSSSFFQDGLGGPTSKDINPALYDISPDLEYDSRVTIGCLDRDGDPWDANVLSDIGIDWTDFENGSDIVSTDGTWYVTPDDDQGQAIEFTADDCSQEYGVLVARLTTFDLDSQIEFQAFLQGKDASGETWSGTAYQMVAYLPTEDCNDNGVSDTCDIANGTSDDADGNGIPDECEDGCDGDVNGDGVVGVNDLLEVIDQWGNAGGSGDVNGDGTVGINDLLAVIDAWGPC